MKVSMSVQGAKLNGVSLADRAMVEFDVPLRIISAANTREHWAAKARRVKQQRGTAKVVTRTWLRRQPMQAPYEVTLTRVRPPRGRPLDDDNLAAALKACRDGVADALGVDDGDRSRVRFVVAEEAGAAWAVRIKVEGRP